jgi:ribosomal protein S27AE
MSEKIEFTCPRCGSKWQKSLAELKQEETVWRGEEKKVIEVRDACPVCGTQAVFQVQED